jgi:hypothetical protein
MARTDAETAETIFLSSENRPKSRMTRTARISRTCSQRHSHTALSSKLGPNQLYMLARPPYPFLPFRISCKPWKRLARSHLGMHTRPPYPPESPLGTHQPVRDAGQHQVQEGHHHHHRVQPAGSPASAKPSAVSGRPVAKRLPPEHARQHRIDPSHTAQGAGATLGKCGSSLPRSSLPKVRFESGPWPVGPGPVAPGAGPC